MDIFTYEYDELTKKTIRRNAGTVPDVSAVPHILVSTTGNAETIRVLKLIYTTIADRPNVDIESRWWDEQSAIQDTEDMLAKIARLTATDMVDALGGKTPYTAAQLKANKAELAALLTTAGYKTAPEWEAALKTSITTAKANRGIIETGHVVKVAGKAPSVAGTGNEWLLPYRGLSTKVTRPVYKGAIPKAILKQLMAITRDKEIRNGDDTLADLAKMNSLLFSMIGSIYGTLTPTALGKIPAPEKAIIDYALKRFATVQTRGDRQLATEGTALIDKLFDREVAIADMVDSIATKG